MLVVQKVELDFQLNFYLGMKNKRIIKKNFEFQKIIGQQKPIKNSSFVIHFIVSDNNYLEYGVSVGKKIGKAFQRNRIKRQVRNLIKNSLEKHGDKSYKIVLIVRPQFLGKSFVENQKNLDSLLGELI